jgi:hypothetical protein
MGPPINGLYDVTDHYVMYLNGTKVTMLLDRYQMSGSNRVPRLIPKQNWKVDVQNGEVEEFDNMPVSLITVTDDRG